MSALRRLLAGVIHRQTRCILLDPYANAFNAGPTGSPWEKDLTAMQPGLHERKYEIDSLCYPVRLTHGYWTATHDASVFGKEWLQAMRLVVRTLQRAATQGGAWSIQVQRVTAVAYDTVHSMATVIPHGPVGSFIRPFDHQ